MFEVRKTAAHLYLSHEPVTEGTVFCQAPHQPANESYCITETDALGASEAFHLGRTLERYDEPKTWRKAVGNQNAQIPF